MSNQERPPDQKPSFVQSAMSALLQQEYFTFRDTTISLAAVVEEMRRVAHCLANPTNGPVRKLEAINKQLVEIDREVRKLTTELMEELIPSTPE